MTWRRGELWFDTDVLWFGEPALVPARAGYASPPPRLAPPPGLVASRLRRAAWKKRRDTRRARAMGIALSPAVVFALAGLRNVADPGLKVGTADEPSSTFRIGSAAARIPEPPIRVPTRHENRMPTRRESLELGAGSLPAAMPRVRRSVAGADPAPKIEWHRARSLGLPFGGSLVDGTQLPIDGPDWTTWNPVTDSVPNEPVRLYGNERTIRAIVSVAHAYRAENPGAPRVVIGDISRKGGGPLFDEHVSHQNGLDVDVYYPRLDGTLRAPTSPDQIDFRLAQDLVNRFVAAGAQMVLIGYSTPLHGPTGVVFPYSSHDNHMHVRFAPPG